MDSNGFHGSGRGQKFCCAELKRSVAFTETSTRCQLAAISSMLMDFRFGVKNPVALNCNGVLPLKKTSPGPAGCYFIGSPNHRSIDSSIHRFIDGDGWAGWLAGWLVGWLAGWLLARRIMRRRKVSKDVQ